MKLVSTFGFFSAAILFQSAIVTSLPSSDPIVNLCKSGQFALTFDQGPAISTGTILDALAEHNVKATFHPVVTFLNEAAVVANLQRAAEEGHLIGLSLEEDFEVSDLSGEDLVSEIDERARIIKEKIGYKPVYLRIPKLKELSSEQLALITKKGYIISTYNIDSYDYSSSGPEDVVQKYAEVLDRMSPNTKGGFIAVQRDYLDHSAEATDKIIEYVKGKGYKVVTLDECAKGKIKDAPGPKGLGPIKSRDSGAYCVLVGSTLLAGAMSLLMYI